MEERSPSTPPGGGRSRPREPAAGLPEEDSPGPLPAGAGVDPDRAEDLESDASAGGAAPEAATLTARRGRDATDGPGFPRAMRLHDFHKPRLLAEADLRALDTIHRKFARTAADALSVLARTRVECLLSFVAQRPYFDFIRSIENPTHLNLVYCLPQKAPFVLEMGASILFPMIERLLGGRGDKDAQPGRPLTRIEQSVAGTIAERFLATLQDAWSACADLQFDIAETEHNPLLMQVVAPSEPSIVLAFSMAAGLRRGAFHLCIPAKPFEPVLGRLTRSVNPGLGSGPASPREREGLLRRLAATEVTVSAELASVPIAIADLLALRPGDVIDTQLGRGSEVALLVDGKRVFRGLGAVREGRRAVRVTRAEVEE